MALEYQGTGSAFKKMHFKQLYFLESTHLCRVVMEGRSPGPATRRFGIQKSRPSINKVGRMNIKKLFLQTKQSN